MTKLIALWTLAGIAGAQSLAPSQPRSTNRTVVVDVVVRNKEGAVAGLTKDDFTLLDKGKAQDILSFTATPRRDANAKLSPPSPQVGSNRITRRGETVQSATIILYDRLNTPVADQAFIRAQVLQALTSLKDTDLFGFYSLGRTLSAVHDFTEDPGPLLHAAARMSANPPQPAPNDPAEQAAQHALEEALQPVQQVDNVFRVAETGRAFQSIARHLSGLPGRKSVIWITRTFPLTFGADYNRRNELDKELSAPTVVLQEENVALFPINPGGVGRGFNDRSTPDTPTEGRLMPNSNASISDTGAISDNSNLDNIASGTGGLAFYNINDILPKVRVAIEDADLTYTLAYSPESKMLDGKLHNLGVKVKASGVTARFRKQYLAAKEDPRLQTPPVPALAADPLDATAIQLMAAGQPDSAKPGYLTVQVAVNVNDLTLSHNGDHWTGVFELGLAVNGEMGASGSLQIFNLTLTDQQLQQAQKSGLVIHGSVNTKNQPAQVRAIVRDKTSGAAGSVRVPTGI